MSLSVFVGWILLKVIPRRLFSVINVENLSLPEMKAKVSSQWTDKKHHFVYVVELYPGNKWVPEPWQEEYVLGWYDDPQKIWPRLQDVSATITELRISERDRHFIPEWEFVVLL